MLVPRGRVPEEVAAIANKSLHDRRRGRRERRQRRIMREARRLGGTLALV